MHQNTIENKLCKACTVVEEESINKEKRILDSNQLYETQIKESDKKRGECITAALDEMAKKVTPITWYLS